MSHLSRGFCGHDIQPARQDPFGYSPNCPSAAHSGAFDDLTSQTQICAGLCVIGDIIRAIRSVSVDVRQNETIAAGEVVERQQGIGAPILRFHDLGMLRRVPDQLVAPPRRNSAARYRPRPLLHGLATMAYRHQRALRSRFSPCHDSIDPPEASRSLRLYSSLRPLNGRHLPTSLTERPAFTKHDQLPTNGPQCPSGFCQPSSSGGCQL